MSSHVKLRQAMTSLVKPRHVKSPARNRILFHAGLVDFGWKVLPGIDLFSQGATPQISSAQQRFTAEFEMDRSGSTVPWTPG